MIDIDIIQFIEDKRFLNDRSLTVAQKTTLKAAYGLKLDDEELEMYRSLTELSSYTPGHEREEITIIWPRRMGKSDKIASNIALYEASCREHRLSIGQTGIVMVVAPEIKRQAKIVFRYIKAKLQASVLLKRMIESITQNCITLNNGVEIQVYPCSVGKVRGESLICFIGDECAYWRHEGIDVDKDVLDSARPGLDFEYSKMVKISTPGPMSGEVFNDYTEYYGKENDDVLVFQGDTETIFPAFAEKWRKKFEREKRRNPAMYETERLAHFKASLSSMYDPAIIDKAVNRDRALELPPEDGVRYVCFVDVSGGGGKDAYALCIAHSKDKRIIVDVVRSRLPKFNPLEYTKQSSELVKRYHITVVVGDKFSGDFASSAWEENEVDYEKSERTKSELYLDAEGSFNTEIVELPNKKILVAQLKSLVRQTLKGGRDRVDTYRGDPEDEANVVVGAIWLLAQDKGDSSAFGIPNVSTAEIWGNQSELENLAERNRQTFSQGPEYIKPSGKMKKMITTSNINSEEKK